jgi:CDGSH-type Zn-finger protein
VGAKEFEEAAPKNMRSAAASTPTTDPIVWVRGGITVQTMDGTTYEVRNRATLCRCGHSGNKPFCDGAHAEAGFKAPKAGESA